MTGDSEDGIASREFAKVHTMKRTCFTVMPFGEGDEYAGRQEESSFVYNDIIRPAATEAVTKFKTQYGDRVEYEVEVLRELEDVSSGAITASIVRHIAESHITIVDLTGRNPNVFLELGMRFALRRNGTHTDGPGYRRASIQCGWFPSCAILPTVRWNRSSASGSD